jgi:transcriptional regulator with XRE-family HTH domain
VQILHPPEDVRLALGFLRLFRGWTQAEMAEHAGVDKSLISLYELGKQAPSDKTFHRLLAGLEVSPPAFESILGCVRQIRFWAGGAGEETARLAAALSQSAGTAVQIAVARAVAELAVGPSPEPEKPEKPEEVEAEALWQRLAKYPADDRRLLVTELRDFQTWGLCERLRAESEREADPARALELAELALEVAARAPGPAPGPGPGGETRERLRAEIARLERPRS